MISRGLRFLTSRSSTPIMPSTPPKLPILAVVGATGTGKSDLAVELAKRYNGEIINGDAMQLYEGLPVITNKITTAEQQGIPHHLLGCISLSEQTWVVGTFVKKALNIIDEIRARGKLPILVGGTHYYTQSLLFHDRLAEGEDCQEKESTEAADFIEQGSMPELERPTEELLGELKRVDPVMAGRWHPNDRRKIQRSLQIFLKTGRKASDIYAEQRLRKAKDSENQDGAGADDQGLPDGPQMRFPTLMFWVHAENVALKARLDNRVDKMLAAGLLTEVQQLYSYADAQAAADTPVEESRGIWVSIGFKEFKSYTKALCDPSTDEATLIKLENEALDKTKAATRQYAKRQLRWIRIKLINELHAANAKNSLYLMDGSDVSAFNSTVVRPALDLTEKFLNGSDLPDPTTLGEAAAELLVPKREDYSAAPEKWTKQHCQTCNKTCVTAEQWEMHIKSRAHRRGATRKPNGLGSSHRLQGSTKSDGNLTSNQD